MTAIAGTITGATGAITGADAGTGGATASGTGRRRAAGPAARAALPAPVPFATAADQAALTVDVRWETPAGHPLIAPPVQVLLLGTYGHALVPGRAVPGQRHDEEADAGVRHESVHHDGRPAEVAARVVVQPADLPQGTSRVLLLLDAGEGAGPGPGAVRVRAESEMTAEPVTGAVPVHTSPAVLLAELLLDGEDWGVRVVGRGLTDGVPGLLRGLAG